MNYPKIVSLFYYIYPFVVIFLVSTHEYRYFYLFIILQELMVLSDMSLGPDYAIVFLF